EQLHRQLREKEAMIQSLAQAAEMHRRTVLERDRQIQEQDRQLQHLLRLTRYPRAVYRVLRAVARRLAPFARTKRASSPPDSGEEDAMSTPRFSVVVPTRERADTLQSCLTTCLDQGFDNYEVIVCDNCSSPATREVVEGFASSRIKYVRAPEPLAMSDNWELA